MTRRIISRIVHAVSIAAVAAVVVGTAAAPAAAYGSGTSSISGTVTRAGGGPLDQPVMVHARLDRYIADWVGYVDPVTGEYAIDGLPAGDFLVTFETVRGGAALERPYLTQYWQGSYSESTATRVSVGFDGQAVDGIDAAIGVGGVVFATASIAGSAAAASGVTMTLYRVLPDGSTRHVNTDAYDPRWPFETGDLAPGEYTIFVDTSGRTAFPALRSQWLGGAADVDDAQRLTVGLDQTVSAQIVLQPVKATDVLPCVHPRDAGALTGLARAFQQAGGDWRSLTRADLKDYLARCR